MMITLRQQLLVAAACAVTLLLVRPALAADAVVSTARDAAQALGTHQRNVRFDLGVRTQFIKGAAFDPFSEHDALTQFTTSASIAFLSRDQLSLAAVAGFDYGGSSAHARSDEASLDVTRLVLAPEVRYHLLRVLALTARLGPTLTREKATLAGGLDTELSKTAWRVGFDATAGAAVELWGFASGTSRKPRLWVTAEGGYGYTASNRLTLKPLVASQAPERFESVELGDLVLGGPLFRITAALSFW
jgi:hypothetical protein